MKEFGVISGRTIVLNRKAINLSIFVFLSIRVSHHSKNWIDRLQNLINKYDEITETLRLTGSENDYMLKIFATSIKA